MSNNNNNNGNNGNYINYNEMTWPHKEILTKSEIRTFRKETLNRIKKETPQKPKLLSRISTRISSKIFRKSNPPITSTVKFNSKPNTVINYNIENAPIAIKGSKVINKTTNSHIIYTVGGYKKKRTLKKNN
jgi:hypothetical protein